jgi:hypothetical protein
MRRSLAITVLCFAAFAPTMLAGCEDGPNQPYSPAGPGATGWNNGNSPGVVNPANQGYGGQGNTGANKNVLCNAEKLHATWSAMVKQPILQNVSAGVDMAGGPKGDGVPDPAYTPTNTANPNESWLGATIDQAEQINCQSAFAFDVFGDGSVYANTWGDNGEVQVWYLTNNRQLYQLSAFAGYLGTVQATSRDKKHTFTIGLNVQTTEDKTTNIAFPWHNDPATMVKNVNAVYDAILSTYSSFPQETDCTTDGHCIIGDFGDQGGYIWFTPLGITLWAASTNAPAPTPSVISEVDVSLSKVMGFSFGSTLMKFDAAGQGPTVTESNVFGTGNNCLIHQGMLYSDFDKNCVAPFSDSAKNAIEHSKLFGGMGHDDEQYAFNVYGCDPNFAATSLMPTSVLGDADRPQAADTLAQIYIDQQALGPISNDFIANDTTQAQDWHGLGLVTLEWAWLAQRQINAALVAQGMGATVHDLGDPACLSATPAAGCTGLEGVVTTAPPAAVAAHPQFKGNALGTLAVTGPVAAGDTPPGRFGTLAQGLKPGRWNSYFCSDIDPAGQDFTGHYTKCSGNALDGTQRYYFDTAYALMTQVAANNNINNLPTDFQDVRYFFKTWIFALVKYLQVADNANATLDQVDAGYINQYDIFDDAVGSGQFEIAEYVDRHLLQGASGKAQPPDDLRFTADVLHGIFNSYEFDRYLYRGETALYTAIRTTPTDQIAAEENALLTNYAGNKVLATAFSSYDCATNGPGTNAQLGTTCPNEDVNPNCAAGYGPLDNNGCLLRDGARCAVGDGRCVPGLGDPILMPYPGAWGQTTFAVGQVSKIKTDAVDLNFEQAVVETPVYTNPYDVGSQPMSPIVKTIPYRPKGANIGFPIAVDGQHNSFIETYNLDYSGVTISASVDYDIALNAMGTQTGLKIDAIETTDFLGDVYVCQDPQTGALLSVRMYTPAANVLAFFQNHPQAVTACGMIFQYSQYGNYLDYVTSQTNGIRMGINPGQGAGRVVDVTVFDSTLVGQ